MAYADFVTAMMALFLVLWFVSQDQKIKEAVERSFRNPFNSLTKQSTGIIPAEKETMTVMAKSGNFDSSSVVELNMLRKIAQDLTAMLRDNPEITGAELHRTEMTPDGMRISVFDRNNKPIFAPTTAEFTVWELDLHHAGVADFRFTNGFNIELEGHTEKGSRVATTNGVYGPWELSADRANASRRKLLEHDVKPIQIRKVAGFADTQPMPNLDPTSEQSAGGGVVESQIRQPILIMPSAFVPFMKSARKSSGGRPCGPCPG